MKVKVKTRIEYSSFSCEPNGLTILYKTSKSFKWKEIPLLYHSIISPVVQIPFVEQLEKFIERGDVKERICDRVKKDIVEDIKRKSRTNKKDDRLCKLLSQFPDKISFEFDEKECTK